MQSHKVKEGLAYRNFDNKLSINIGYRVNPFQMAGYWREGHPVLIGNSYDNNYPFLIRLKTVKSKLIRTMLDNTYQID